jgi:ATP-binding cassette subfamily B protein
MVLASVCSLMIPMLMSLGIDECIETGDMRLFPYLIAGMVVLSALGSIFTRTRIRIMHRAGRGAIAHLREDLFKHIQGLSFSFFDSRSAGKIMVRVINDVNSLIDLFTNGIVQVW